MVKNPFVRTCGLVEHGASSLSVACDGRLVLTYLEKQVLFSKPEGILRSLDLTPIADTPRSVVSATINHIGDAVFVATQDSGIWKAPVSTAGDIGPATRLMEDAVLSDAWYLRQMHVSIQWRNLFLLPACLSRTRPFLPAASCTSCMYACLLHGCAAS